MYMYHYIKTLTKKLTKIKTPGHPETFRLYQNLTESITAVYNNTPPSTTNTPSAPPMTFDQWKDHMHTVNKGGTTLHDVWGCMLTEVQGLGPEAVSTILAAYPTPISLFRAYRDVVVRAQRVGRSGRVAAEELLAGLKNARNGRCIGIEKSRKVFRDLFASGWDVVAV